MDKTEPPLFFCTLPSISHQTDCCDLLKGTEEIYTYCLEITCNHVKKLAGRKGSSFLLLCMGRRQKKR